jgi:hypothetical protein
MTLLAVISECETWSLTLREGHSKKKMFENRALKGTYGPKREA